MLVRLDLILDTIDFIMSVLRNKSVFIKTESDVKMLCV